MIGWPGARSRGGATTKRKMVKGDSPDGLPLITALVTARPTYGYRRVTALLNRQLPAEGSAPVNHKRVYRIMQAHDLLLARRCTERPELAHEGKVVTIRSDIRWCSDGFEFTRLGTATLFAVPSSWTRTTGRSFCQRAEGSQSQVRVPISAWRCGQETNYVPRSKVIDLDGSQRIIPLV